jgi:hypothetical protein
MDLCTIAAKFHSGSVYGAKVLIMVQFWSKFREKTETETNNAQSMIQL